MSTIVDNNALTHFLPDGQAHALQYLQQALEQDFVSDNALLIRLMNVFELLNFHYFCSLIILNPFLMSWSTPTMES